MKLLSFYSKKLNSCLNFRKIVSLEEFRSSQYKMLKSSIQTLQKCRQSIVKLVARVCKVIFLR